MKVKSDHHSKNTSHSYMYILILLYCTAFTDFNTTLTSQEHLARVIEVFQFLHYNLRSYPQSKFRPRVINLLNHCGNKSNANSTMQSVGFDQSKEWNCMCSACVMCLTMLCSLILIKVLEN